MVAEEDAIRATEGEGEIGKVRMDRRRPKPLVFCSRKQIRIEGSSWRHDPGESFKFRFCRKPGSSA
jgi:hypothetical protein